MGRALDLHERRSSSKLLLESLLLLLREDSILSTPHEQCWRLDVAQVRSVIVNQHTVPGLTVCPSICFKCLPHHLLTERRINLLALHEWLEIIQLELCKEVFVDRLHVFEGDT